MGKGRPAKKKSGKLDPTKREDIILVYQYFVRLRQKDRKKDTYKASIYRETGKALNVHPDTVKLVVMKKKGSLPTECETEKSRCKLDNFDKELIRRTVYDFYRVRDLPTVPKILAKIKPDLDISSFLLRSVLKELGFKWTKTTENRKIFVQRPDIVASRAWFLRTIKEYRSAGYQVVYVDETWVNKNHCRSHSWYPVLVEAGLVELLENKEIELPNIPSGKGGRLIVLHAEIGRAHV